MGIPIILMGKHFGHRNEGTSDRGRIAQVIAGDGLPCVPANLPQDLSRQHDSIIGQQSPLAF
ncbi:MAG: hypothetical protein EA401_14120 [Planctomycetota bacterium]|nr:MAG: hypothetical protein EA401_14120 [Planctomycetota bacterium]